MEAKEPQAAVTGDRQQIDVDARVSRSATVEDGDVWSMKSRGIALVE